MNNIIPESVRTGLIPRTAGIFMAESRSTGGDAAMFWDQNLMSLFLKGGFAMWPLLACSVIGVAIILERSIYLARLGLNYDRFLIKLKALLRADQIKEAMQYC